MGSATNSPAARWPLLSALAASACFAAAQPAAAAPISAQQAAAYLNQQRAANGIPGRVADDPNLDAACAHHDHYRSLNPNDYAHDEDPSHPGYTPDGQTYGAPGVQEGPGGPYEWSATRNPWSDFPLHLAQIMGPAQQDGMMGYAEADRYACLTQTGPDLVPPDPRVDAFASVPGAGTSGIPPEEDCFAESPPCPAEAAGLDPASHGRTIILYPYGWSWDASTRGAAQAWPHMISFALTGPSGAIDARWGDDPIVGPAIGYIVPVQPLERFTQYTASVTWQLDTGETHTQTVPFTTGDTLPKDRPVAPPAPRPKNPRLHVRLGHFGHRVTAEVTVLLKARGRVTVRARNGHSARRLGKGKASTFGTVRRLVYAATLPRGSWRVVVRFSGTHRWGSRALARRVRIR